LSTLVHEFGHYLGLAHTSAGVFSVMAPTLSPGTRWLLTPDDPALAQLANLEPGGNVVPEALLATPNSPGWSFSGAASINGGLVELREVSAAGSEAIDALPVPSRATALRFVLSGAGLGPNSFGPQDAFEFALYGADG